MPRARHNTPRPDVLLDIDKNLGARSSAAYSLATRWQIVDVISRQIDELRVEAARLLSEAEKTKRAAEKLAERIKRLEKAAH